MYDYGHQCGLGMGLKGGTGWEAPLPLLERARSVNRAKCLISSGAMITAFVRLLGVNLDR